MEKKVLFSFGSMLLILLGFIVYQNIDEKNSNEKEKRAFLQLVETYYNDQDYESTRRLAEVYLTQHPENSTVIELYNNSLSKTRIIEPDPATDFLSGDVKSLLRNLSGKIDRLTALNSGPASEILSSDRRNILSPEIRASIKQMLDEGIEAFGKTDLVTAKKKFAEILKLDDQNTLANTYLGATLYKENPDEEQNVKKIIKYCQVAVRNDSSIELAHYTLAQVYNAQGMADLAVGEYLEAFTLNPLKYETSLALGKILYLKSNWSESVKYLSIACKQKPDAVEIYYYLGLCFDKQGKTAEAIKTLKVACEKDYGYYAPIQKLGELYFETKQYEPAELMLLRAIGLKESSWDSYLLVGQIYYSQNKFEKAKDFLTALKIKNKAFDRMSVVDDLLKKMGNL